MQRSVVGAVSVWSSSHSNNY